MELLSQMTSILSIFNALSGVFGADVMTSPISFGVQAQCNGQTCPGSFFTAVATAWANIGYMTHADILELVDKTRFGTWAILLYICAAIAAFIGVATNSPLRNYTWFFIGPALYSFLVGTTIEVRGVNWVVATQPAEDLSDVWRIAETGLANTRLATSKKVDILGKDGPSGAYEVAYPMVMLDGLFSATTNQLVEFTGILNENAGSGNTNLSAPSGGVTAKDTKWYLLSSLKWPMLENIVGNTFRDPALRDAFVTFLSSECGDKFKDGIDSAMYISATQSLGSVAVPSVMVGRGASGYAEFQEALDDIAIPTPRALASIFRGKDDDGSIKRFTPKLSGSTMLDAGRGQGIVCSEYLWTLIQGMRWEAGHAYYQLLRSAPRGFTEDQFIRTLFYGWDIKSPSGKMDKDEQAAFVKHLILAYLLRNELLYAPQITSVDQRHAPSEQSRSYGDAYVRTSGSKMKYTELYNAAIMMPYIQGILAYIIIAAYPIASMLIILPGHFKGFFTWVAFFAWIKLWDVGFAMVQVIERSVWAMLGSNSAMAATSKSIIETVQKVGGIGVEPSGASTFAGPTRPGELEAMFPIPKVCSITGPNASSCAGAGQDQSQELAWELLDKMLVVSANADLDLANGWYIYIMSALYLAVPAVTGQLVLGAKAGMAGMAKDAFQGIGNDAGGAARTGYQHAATNAALTNQNSLAQAAAAKAMNASGALQEAFNLRNAMLDHGLAKDRVSGVTKAHEGRAQMLGQTATDLDAVRGAMNGNLQDMQKYGRPFAPGGAIASMSGGVQEFSNKYGGSYGKKLADGLSKLDGYAGKAGDMANGVMGQGYGRFAPVATPATGGAGGAGSGSAGNSESDATKNYRVGGAMASISAHQSAGMAKAKAAGISQDAYWNTMEHGQLSTGKNQYAQNLQHQGDFDVQSSVWEAKNAFASHVAASAGIAGMNAGSLNAGQKPTDLTGMAMNGMLDGHSVKRNADGSVDRSGGWGVTSIMSNRNVSGAAHYSGEGYLSNVRDTARWGRENLGGSYVESGYVPTGIQDLALRGEIARFDPSVHVAPVGSTVSQTIGAGKQWVSEAIPDAVKEKMPGGKAAFDSYTSSAQIHEKTGFPEAGNLATQPPSAGGTPPRKP